MIRFRLYFEGNIGQGKAEKYIKVFVLCTWTNRGAIFRAQK